MQLGRVAVNLVVFGTVQISRRSPIGEYGHAQTRSEVGVAARETASRPL